MSENPVFFMKAYLWAKGENWSEEQVSELVSRFADFLTANGFENPSKKSEEPINTIIVAGQEYHSDEPQKFFERIVNTEDSDVVLIVVPAPNDEEDEKAHFE